MDLEKISAIFTLFSNQSATEYIAVLELSMTEVERKLKADADTADARLNYLCGAIANMRYVEIDGAREKQRLTAGGGIEIGNNKERLIAAGNIVSQYCGICADLLTDNDFLFIKVRG